MRTRSAETSKSATAAKVSGIVPTATPNHYMRRPKNSPPKAQATPLSVEANIESCPMQMATPTIVEPKRASAGRPKQIGSTPDSKSQPAKQVGQKSEAAKGSKTVKKVVRKVIRKAPVSTRAVSGQFTESGAVEKVEVGQTTKEKTMEDMANIEATVDEPMTQEMPLVENVEPSVVEDINIGNLGKSSDNEKEEESEPEEYLMEAGEELHDAIKPNVTDAKSVEDRELCVTNEKEYLKEEKEEQRKIVEPKVKHVGMEEHLCGKVKLDGAPTEDHDDEKIEGLSDQEVLEDFGEDFADDDALENEMQAQALEEHVELNSAVQERKVRKEREIFVGGLGRDAVLEDVRKVFSYAGQVVEVRMHVDPSTNKNKGYAFVQFATKEQAARALAEMKNPVIRGKRCGTAPSEDNDTLFLGNICNTWTKEAVKQKLKDYGVEGVENITLVADLRYEGLSRGFAFVQFSSHGEAMLAYKRLQKPDVVFGHSERTARVAFAEPLREPDPEVMAQIKSVFVDGLPSHWDEDRVRHQLKNFGEIARIMLARNMPTAKRNDFGFIDFATHEAAVSCVDGVNSNGLTDGNSKVKVRARLSNPLPKMQAVKGGMRGGFRIGLGRSGTLSRSSGRGSGGYPFKRANMLRGRGFYSRGPGHGGRMDFSNEHGVDCDLYPPLHEMSNFGRGTRWDSKGAHQGSLPARPYPDRLRHDTADRGYWNYDLYRGYPYSFEDRDDRSFMGRHFDDPYPYDDVSHGIKRPYYMMDQDPHLAEPSRYRPRLDRLDPVVPFRGNRYQAGDLARGSGPYCEGYYDSPYARGSYPLFYGEDQTYRRGYYY